MRKSTLQDGTPFFGIKVEHFVTKRVFVIAIASYTWNRKVEFSPHTSRTQAMKILKEQLFFQGIHGLYTDHWDGASIEFVQPYQDAIDIATIWIEKNYPYLK